MNKGNNRTSRFGPTGLEKAHDKCILLLLYYAIKVFTWILRVFIDQSFTLRNKTLTILKILSHVLVLIRLLETEANF